MWGGVATLKSKGTESATLLSQQESIDDFPRDQRQEDRRFSRDIQEPDEPHEGVQQVRIQRTDGYRPHRSLISRRGVTGLKQDLTDEAGGQFQAQTEVGPLL